MRVLVAATAYECPAHLALAAEGVDHVVALVDDELTYAQLLEREWSKGGGFVLVEHDIAPWPGAIDALLACPRDWCAHRYPKGGRLVRALGCVKFSEGLVRNYPTLPDAWRGASWEALEGRILMAVGDALRTRDDGAKPVCDHLPPVAHVKAGS